MERTLEKESEMPPAPILYTSRGVRPYTRGVGELRRDIRLWNRRYVRLRANTFSVGMPPPRAVKQKDKGNAREPQNQESRARTQAQRGGDAND